ncbi:MAG TPA: SgcJ/EcaC family oxidoreductase [Balneolaceae bacterium]|nr:SgcJ/EcaC family oxidoreductase [Balneolaceae bacterium]
MLPIRAISQTEDKTEIRKTAMEQAVAWNHHDASAYAALFTENCDVVNVPGWRWKGRQELEKNLTAAFSSAFRNSRLTITNIDIRFLSPDIAVAHARWTMTGAKMPPGIPKPEKGIQTLIFVKKNDSWLITAFQNTLSLRERTFPVVGIPKRKK